MNVGHSRYVEAGRCISGYKKGGIHAKQGETVAASTAASP